MVQLVAHRTPNHAVFGKRFFPLMDERSTSEKLGAEERYGQNPTELFKPQTVLMASLIRRNSAGRRRSKKVIQPIRAVEVAVFAGLNTRIPSYVGL